MFSAETKSMCKSSQGINFYNCSELPGSKDSTNGLTFLLCKLLRLFRMQVQAAFSANYRDFWALKCFGDILIRYEQLHRKSGWAATFQDKYGFSLRPNPRHA